MYTIYVGLYMQYACGVGLGPISNCANRLHVGTLAADYFRLYMYGSIFKLLSFRAYVNDMVTSHLPLEIPLI